MATISNLVKAYITEEWSDYSLPAKLPDGPAPKQSPSFMDRLKAKVNDAALAGKTAFARTKSQIQSKAPLVGNAAKDILGKAAQHVADNRERYGAAAGAVAGGAIGAYKGVRDHKNNSLFGITTKTGRRAAGIQGAVVGAKIGSSIGASLAAATRK